MESKTEKGFSLAEILIAAGLLSIVSLGAMHLIKNIGQAQNFAQSKSDEIELGMSIRMILNDKRHCRVSLAGNGPAGAPTSPVTFNKIDVDQDGEGLDIELFLSNQAGDTRATKKVSAIDTSSNKFGKLKITSVKLLMNNGVGSNYSASPKHNDIGVLRVVFEKKITSSKIIALSTDFDVNVEMSTTTSGLSSILSCSESTSSKELNFESDINIIAAPGYGTTTCVTTGSGNRSCKNFKEVDFDICFASQSSVQDSSDSLGISGTIRTYSCRVLQIVSTKKWQIEASFLQNSSNDSQDAVSCRMRCYSYN